MWTFRWPTHRCGILLIKRVIKKDWISQPAVWLASIPDREKLHRLDPSVWCSCADHNYWFSGSLVPDSTVFWAHVRRVWSTGVYLIYHVTSIIHFLTKRRPAVPNSGSVLFSGLRSRSLCVFNKLIRAFWPLPCHIRHNKYKVFFHNFFFKSGSMVNKAGFLQ